MDTEIDTIDEVETATTTQVVDDTSEGTSAEKPEFQVGLIILYVNDIAKSREFYVDFLGIPYVPQMSGDEFILLRPVGGSQIALDVASHAPEGLRHEPGGCELSFMVDDVNAVHQAWSELGVPGVTPIFDMGAGLMFRAQDPDERIINVYTLHPHIAAMQ